MTVEIVQTDPLYRIPPVEQTGGILLSEIASATDYALHSKAESSRRAYRSDWQIFTAWAKERNLCSLPASIETVAAFLASQADSGFKPSTLNRRMAAIRYAHLLEGHQSPTDDEKVRSVLRGIRREKGVAPDKKSPALAEIVISMVSHCPDTIKGKRDRALLLIGFAGAFRVSELVDLEIRDIEFKERGLSIRIRRSKTDPESKGQEIAIVPGRHACPVEALKTWIEASNIKEGKIFRSIRKNGIIGGDISTKGATFIVKKYASMSGLDASCYSPHSLRAGLATSAAERGANIFKIMEVTRHRSVETLKGYVRSTELFQDHAAEGLL